MIQKVEMYQAVCDGCGGIHFSTLSHRSIFESPDSAMRSARLYGWRKINGKFYCSNCVEYDEETDSYKPKERSEQL